MDPKMNTTDDAAAAARGNAGTDPAATPPADPAATPPADQLLLHLLTQLQHQLQPQLPLDK